MLLARAVHVATPHSIRVPATMVDTAPPSLRDSPSLPRAPPSLPTVPRTPRTQIDDDAEEQSLPATGWWTQLDGSVPVRGSSYLDDRAKVPSAAAVCTPFAANAYSLRGEHSPGASAALLQGGDVVPPPWARTVFTIYFMNPRLTRHERDPHHVLMLHFASSVPASEAPGPEGALLRELWAGDVATAASRVKVLSALQSGPTVLVGALKWIGLDGARPLLICKQLDAAVHRATLAHAHPRDDSPRTYEHIELALDVAGAPMACMVYRHSASGLSSVDVDIRVLLEGRSAAELPERPLAAITIRKMSLDDLRPLPPSWPARGEPGGALPGGPATLVSTIEIRDVMQRAGSAKPPRAEAAGEEHHNEPHDATDAPPGEPQQQAAEAEPTRKRFARFW